MQRALDDQGGLGRVGEELLHARLGRPQRGGRQRAGVGDEVDRVLGHVGAERLARQRARREAAVEGVRVDCPPDRLRAGPSIFAERHAPSRSSTDAAGAYEAARLPLPLQRRSHPVGGFAMRTLR